MPAPATVDEFVDLIRKSAVLEEARLSSYVQKLKTDPTAPKDLSSLAGRFVHDGLLTFFQAEQFLQGKWKRFTIGKYKVLERLGSGGMGQVFLCEHKLMRRRVAVKVLPTQKAADPSSLDRFYREARAVAALDHPNIVRAYDIDQDDTGGSALHFLVMEYVDGASLQEMIRKTGPMTPIRACHYMYWSAVGLQHAHQQGLIHRDIKPGNILVDRLGVVKILDLGLARFFHDEDDLLTKKYDESVLGTADYLAPEQAVDSHTVDGRADIYSLGATFYFLLTGQPPFAEGTVAQKLLWHQNRAPKPVREVRPDVPEDVAKIVAKMMAKDPADRYQTPGELADALLPFTQTPIPPPPESEMPTLSAAAQAGGPTASSMSVPALRNGGSAPKTPAPVPGPKAPASNPKPPAPKPAARPAPGAPKPSVAVADADTQRNKAAPTVEPLPEPAPHTPIWESISAETANASRADTDRTKRDGSSRRAKAAPKSTAKAAAKSGKLAGKRRFSTPVIIAAAGGLMLIGAAVVAAVYFGTKDKSTKPDSGNVQPRTLTVARGASGPGQFGSVSEAIDQFRPGDTIVLTEDVEEAVVKSGTKKLTIVAADGKPITWRAPAKNNQNAILSLFAADGAKVSGIIFEAGPNVEFAVRLSGPCTGLSFDRCEFRGGKTAALCMHDCTGTAGAKVQITKCRIAGQGAKAGLQFNADPSKVAGNPVQGSQNVLVQNCMIEGSDGGSAVEFAGSAAAELRHCRMWKGANGVQFKRATDRSQDDLLWNVTLTGNTFHSQANAGLWFEDGGQMKNRKANKVSLAQNFFAEPANVPAIKIDADATAPVYLVVDGSNALKQGTVPIQPPNVQPAPPFIGVPDDVIVDPNNWARNLTYDKKSPLFIAGPGKKAVGAPPE